MERTMWTDERLSERFDGIDRRFDGVEGRLDRIEQDIRDLRHLVFQLWGTTMVGFVGTIATVLLTNT